MNEKSDRVNERSDRVNERSDRVNERSDRVNERSDHVICLLYISCPSRIEKYLSQKDQRSLLFVIQLHYLLTSKFLVLFLFFL